MYCRPFCYWFRCNYLFLFPKFTDNVIEFISRSYVTNFFVSHRQAIPIKWRRIESQINSMVCPWLVNSSPFTFWKIILVMDSSLFIIWSPSVELFSTYLLLFMNPLISPSYSYCSVLFALFWFFFSLFGDLLELRVSSLLICTDSVSTESLLIETLNCVLYELKGMSWSLVLHHWKILYVDVIFVI